MIDRPTRSRVRVQLARSMKRRRVTLLPTRRATKRALVPTSATFRAGVKALDWSRHVARLATLEEPRRSRGLTR